MILYADGGVIGANPSKIGGTIAWCIVDPEKDEALLHGGTIISPADVDGEVVTNNNAELLAILDGLFMAREAAIPIDRVASDSKNALGWCFWFWKLDNVPLIISDKVHEMRREGYFTDVWTTLLGGHPTKADLLRGTRAKHPQLPVSKWNVACDKKCSQMARDYLEHIPSKDSA